MSLEDLERRGLLLPRDQWRDHAPPSPAAWPIILAVAVQIAGGVVAYLGNGNLWTWIGLGVFLLSLSAFTILSVRASGQPRGPD